MTFADDLAAAKVQMSHEGIDVVDVLDDAVIERSTWTRWNNGSTTAPHYDTWMRFRASLARLIERKRVAA